MHSKSIHISSHPNNLWLTRPIVFTEADYLCAIFNSCTVKLKISNRGNYGYRDICRRPLMLPIPKFSLQMEDHVTLASLSNDCPDIVKYYKFVKKGSNLESESKIFD